MGLESWPDRDSNGWSPPSLDDGGEGEGRRDIDRLVEDVSDVVVVVVAITTCRSRSSQI